MDFYIDGTISNINKDLEARDSLKDKLAYLHKEKKRFAADNKGQDADIVLAWFTDEIHKVKDMGVAEAKNIILSELKRYDDLPGQLKYLYQEYENHIDNAGSDKITIWLQQKIALTEKKKENVTQPAKKTPKQKTSYRWLGTQDQLSDFCKELIGKFILPDEDTDDDSYIITIINDVKAIFSAKPLNEIKPVRWHEDNATELIYFITEIGEKGIIKAGSRSDYKTMKACFVKPDGTPFDTSSWPSLKQKRHYNLSKAKQEAIDKLARDQT